MTRRTGSPYDRIAHVYDAWTDPYRPDIDFYVSQAAKVTGPVVELGVGTGRVAVPMAARGVTVIGVDASSAMLAECRRAAEQAGVGNLIDLRLGDFRRPPVSERVELVTSPYRALAHLESDADRGQALAAIHRLLKPGGRFLFDVFTASTEAVGVRTTEWKEHAPGVWEQDRWDAGQRTMHVSLRSGDDEADLRFAWLHREEWRTLLEDAGFEVYACYGWFDLSPCARDGLAVWVARRPS